MVTNTIEATKNFRAETLAQFLAFEARRALIDEAELTPKPALVDKRGSGAHRDLNLSLLIRSANCLFPYFVEMGQLSFCRPLTPELRAALADCGIRAELAMLAATGGSNAHRGAIWSLGLLLAAASIHELKASFADLSNTASLLSRMNDYRSDSYSSHGKQVERQYGFGGAKQEGDNGFPHVFQIGVPALQQARRAGLSPDASKLTALISIMAELNDTCLIHRAGKRALAVAKEGAREVLKQGGPATLSGMKALLNLDAQLLKLNASPGGSADLLAASLFVEMITYASYSGE